MSLTGPDGNEWNFYDDYDDLQEDIEATVGFNWYFIPDVDPIYEQHFISNNGAFTVSLLTWDQDYKHWLFIDSKGNICDAVSNRMETLNPEK